MSLSWLVLSLAPSHKSPPQAWVASGRVLAANGQRQRPFGPDQNHDPPASGYSRVEQISPQHRKMLRAERDYDRRVFAPLTLVNGEGVRKAQRVQLIEIVDHGPAIEI